MSEIWQKDGMTLYLGDCLEVMKELPDNSVDAVITDPPYNVSKKGSKIARGSGSVFTGGDINLDFGEWDMGNITWKNFIDDFIRVLTPNGVVVMFYEKLLIGHIGTYLTNKYDCQVRHVGAYVKKNPAPQARKVKWMNGLEFFLIVTKNKGMGHHFNYKLGQSPDYFIRTVNYKRWHPTQKPEDLMKWLVQYWTFEDDTILDPFMGAGTTGVACANLSRNFIGIELDPDYFKIAEKRIQEAQQQIRMAI